MFKFLKKNKTIEVISPITGKVLNMKEVPDKMFSEKMIGDGVAIEPKEGLVISPIDGTVATIFPTNHAIGLITKEGLEILIHIGIDTVELKGEGFKALTVEGNKVKKGDPLMEFDLDIIKKAGKLTITPIIITNMDKVKKLEKTYGETKKGTGSIFTVELI